jgi:hypothetical protein
VFLTLGFALIGTFIGFAIDFGHAYLEKARISRLVDGAALAAAKALKGQSGFEDEATRAACDSMVMNGAPVIMAGPLSCTTTTGAPLTVALNFFDVPVDGGPPIKHVSVTGTEPVATTFLNFLSWMVPGDYTKINVSAMAEAAPERPIDLMLVLDRSGSMTATDGNGQQKIVSLRAAVSAFLGLSNTFSSDDRIGLVTFASRGCGNASGQDSTVNGPCTPDMALDFTTSAYIAALQSRVNGLNAAGGTNTMEALRTARPPLAAAFNDANRATTRKAVLLVTDGQPTFMMRNTDFECKHDPRTNALLPAPGDGNTNGGPFTNGCKHGVNVNTMLRQPLTNNSPSSGFTSIGASTQYLNTIRCTRALINCNGMTGGGGAMFEGNRIRNCGFGNSACGAGGNHDIVIFVIAIGRKDLANPQQSMDENAKCLLGRIANATDIMNAATGTMETMAANCNAKFTTNDNDTHADLVEGWPCGTGPCIDSTQEKGRVYMIDSNGNVQTQLQTVFDEIAKLLKLRLVM